jgi:hypothetical protein
VLPRITPHVTNDAGTKTKHFHIFPIRIFEEAQHCIEGITLPILPEMSASNRDVEAERLPFIPR